MQPHRLLSHWMPLGRDVRSRNVRRVLIDGIGVGIAAAAAPYLPVFLARLGAENFAIGLLTSMPALAGLGFAIPIGQFLARRRNIVPWYSGARFLVILCYAVTGLVPFLVGDRLLVPAILLIWALATIPQTVVNVGFTVVMSGVSGPDGRYYLMSRRWSSLGVTTALVVALAGFVLERLPFPINYQIVFIVLSFGGVISFAFSSRIELPDQVAPPQPRALPLRERAQRWLARLRRQERFVRVIGSQFIYRFGLAFAIPLFPLYYVRVLHASDEQIGLINTIQGAVLLVAYYLWARVTKQRGVRFALLTTTLALALYPLFLSLIQRVEWVILLAALAGIFAAGIDLVFFDIVVASFPSDQAPTYVGLQQTTVNLANFIAPLVATTLATAIGIPVALALAGLIRLLGFGIFLLFASD